ncbi:MarR family winged helix-turn-helix transcriptional regulator [Roseivivax sediminis]|uniref:DNA-binding transcriptional regulator, MarR family n=1 Tax=Roseivivax sediminis TaxID=936889 RepID=A0A1I1X588_9RHOB|nr:MarR family winged helix-turn-helix transcriptional regulator [Roseivivax sediminis]SFE02381.1 DNA-binding transcriptional regulator, MarR family [Roseivivax sediminis]
MSKDLPDFHLARFLPYRLTVAGAHLSAGLARRYKAEFGISVAEWRILVHLADAGEVSIRDLEARVHLEKSKASRAASRLVAAGHVTKVPNADDRRLVRLSLSDGGRALMGELLPMAAAYQEKLEIVLGPHLHGLEAALDRLMAEDL